MRNACSLLLVAVGLAIAASALDTPASAADGPVKPNVVVILGDDMGYGDIGVHGADIRRPTSTPSPRTASASRTAT